MARQIEVEVEMQMRMEGKIIRRVQIPYLEVATADTDFEILQRIVHWGQNNHQPLEDVTDVGPGDIIRWAGKRYLILKGQLGFATIVDPAFPRTKQELLTYLETWLPGRAQTTSA